MSDDAAGRKASPPLSAALEQLPSGRGSAATDRTLRRVVASVAALNLGYFALEFAVARSIGSVSLFADSIDFLEDTALNTLVLLTLGWHQRHRPRVATVLALLLLLPGLATIWTAVRKVLLPVPPSPLLLSLTAAGALAVNLSCALLLARVRHHGGSLSRAAFLSARNDVYANVAILAAAGLTVVWRSAWPDLAVGLGILAMSVGAAREVYARGRQERQLPSL
jgi:Co/Zn/Cd efflux system component